MTAAGLRLPVSLLLVVLGFSGCSLSHNVDLPSGPKAGDGDGDFGDGDGDGDISIGDGDSPAGTGGSPSGSGGMGGASACNPGGAGGEGAEPCETD